MLVSFCGLGLALLLPHGGVEFGGHFMSLYVRSSRQTFLTKC